MDNPVYDQKIEVYAPAIAKMIRETDTELRGNLLLRVAEILRHEAQGSTSNLIKSAAVEYGIKMKRDRL